jgi:hypothetical protein
MTELETKLLRVLCPEQTLNITALQQDMLQPIDDVAKSLTAIRETVLNRLALVVNLADMVEQQDVNAREMQELVATFATYIQQLTEQEQGILQRFDSMSEQVTVLIDTVTTLLDTLTINTTLEREVLLKLKERL